MFSAIRSTAFRVPLCRAFATTRPVGSDLSKLTLIGRLAKDPETRLTKNEKEYCVYTVATANPRGPPNAEGERPPSTTTFHRIMSFNEPANKYIRNLTKGTKVYVEAGFEMREAESGADPSTYQGQRQIFLRHETIRLIQKPKSENPESSERTETDYTSGY
ncbi:hypothetical protein HYPSUDRAFT_38648 [Hypholoma sublateritium FD-334 SS-4]|uniref:Single-stranded DNA-binding protein n=1 Tax=Hypholoma sublateritium (strain FD-334 SS-4) TaxID=945553 RepID=A0A0D2LBH3_HYPSF|nr:hypothetical protein HYPSUDRAFT_38648 [Hypholoma sublateritium FD-334 SS-4]